MRIFIAVISIITLLACNEESPVEAKKVIYLTNSNLKIGILNEVGGRMVYFGTSEGINFLKSDSSQWHEPDSVRIIPSAYSDFKAYNGMITWIGPQSEWWKHQNLNQERLNSRAVWPPDPYLTYGKYQIIQKTDALLKIEGPPSPVSGLQLTKEYSISENKLQITVTAKNISDTIVSWDLWTNARFDSNTRYMVPTSEKGILRIDANETSEKEKMDDTCETGVFYFVPKEFSAGKKQLYAKAFIYPEVGNMLAIKDKYILKISFEKIPIIQIHPEQALIEVFHSISSNGGDDLLELEHHSAYTTLKPGESFRLSETWSLHNNQFENEQQTIDFLYQSD